MPSLSPKDRVSLCLFSFTDGRRCRTPRIATHPHFCFYHAQKESQSLSTEKLAKDLTYFFSGDYLSANDLNAALGRLIPAVIRGEIKPRVARTVAYMLQTLMQSSRQAQHEYINAFSTDGWRDAIATSVKSNHDHLYPPDPNDPDLEDDSEDDSEDEIENASADGIEDEIEGDPANAPESQHPAPTTVGAGLAGPAGPNPPTPPPQRPSPADTEAALAAARSLFPDRTKAAQSQPSAPTTNPTPTQPAQPNKAPTVQPPPPQPQRSSPNRDPYAVHFDHTHRLLIDGKPW